MKTSTIIILIVVGLLIFALGCAIGEGIAMTVSMLGAIIMLAGLLPIIDKEAFAEIAKKKE